MRYTFAIVVAIALAAVVPCAAQNFAAPLAELNVKGSSLVHIDGGWTEVAGGSSIVFGLRAPVFSYYALVAAPERALDTAFIFWDGFIPAAGQAVHGVFVPTYLMGYNVDVSAAVLSPTGQTGWSNAFHIKIQ